MNAHDKAIIRRIVRRVMNEIPVGRVAASQDTCELMMERFADIRGGKHLEIGVLFGGTLIMAALVSKALGLDREIIGLDPLCGYYPPSPLHPDGIYDKKLGNLSRETDIRTGLPVTLESLQKNLDYFEACDRVRIVEKFSWPWPDELKNEVFTSVYIDGDHFGDGPLLDWMHVFPRVAPGGLVWFDDCTDLFPAIQHAVEIARRTGEWTEIRPPNPQTAFLSRKA